ncbi:hypothetical protein TRIUR3_23218 [Triticum urartu]|uniref:Uncharacterized protein n=1 Tax=Triticum urartu TaxID=4572 RepID=M7YJF3_TRIUA|nr:hypothetical protein TRIUR3_23218 [Triticum urartu]
MAPLMRLAQPHPPTFNAHYSRPPRTARVMVRSGGVTSRVARRHQVPTRNERTGTGTAVQGVRVVASRRGRDVTSGCALRLSAARGAQQQEQSERRQTMSIGKDKNQDSSTRTSAIGPGVVLGHGMLRTTHAAASKPVTTACAAQHRPPARPRFPSRRCCAVLQTTACAQRGDWRGPPSQHWHVTPEPSHPASRKRRDPRHPAAWLLADMATPAAAGSQARPRRLPARSRRHASTAPSGAQQWPAGPPADGGV